MSAICVKGGSGMVLPLFGDAEQEWPRGVRVILYLLGLFWSFSGVALIADVFMGAIEKVTSKKDRLYSKELKRFYTFEVWNETVANLTLMALGSSAPEILLNVIDIFAKGFKVEGLGPSTIVGSAAFNLLMIIAVCIVAIPDGETRNIKEMPVYMCTAFFSIFAYVWLIFILQVTTPDEVTAAEGIVTFLFFPILTFCAFLADKGYLGGGSQKSSPVIAGSARISVHEDMLPEEWAEAEGKIRQDHGQKLTDEQCAKLMTALYGKPKTRAHYRIAATRALCGGRRVAKTGNKLVRSMSQKMSSMSSMMYKKRVVPVDDEGPKCWMAFHCEKYAVLENQGSISVTISRGGDLTFGSRVWYFTRDGDAKAGDDYTPKSGWAVFGPGEHEVSFAIKIVDDCAYEEDEDFFVELDKPEMVGDLGCDMKDKVQACLGDKTTCTITIIDDDEPGMLAFAANEQTVDQRVNDYDTHFAVIRKNGSSGEVSVNYVVEGDSAIPGLDFEAKGGTLHFAHNQMEAYIAVTIKGKARYDSKDTFRIIIQDTTGGAKFDPNMDGGAAKSILTVTIEADHKTKERVDNVKKLIEAKWQKSKIGHAHWGQQFKEALYVNGGEDDDDDEGGESAPSWWDYVAHALTLPWKLLFALVPPTDFCDGWICFFCSLLMIGFVTMIIGDMASLLGCVMCIPDDITAITFVALGTSLPDTFASKTAATQDMHADASVGNVTGSNSVNVFLGLGLPWMIAALHWTVKGEAFVVHAGTLAFSVTVFSCCAFVCLTLLTLRRRFCGGELGGSTPTKYMSAGLLTTLWCIYIILSSWKSLSMSGGATCAS